MNNLEEVQDYLNSMLSFLNEDTKTLRGSIMEVTLEYHGKDKTRIDVILTAKTKESKYMPLDVFSNIKEDGSEFTDFDTFAKSTLKLLISKIGRGVWKGPKEFARVGYEVCMEGTPKEPMIESVSFDGE